MSNILTPQTQRDVWRMYRSRFIVTGSLLVIAAAGIACVSLLPMYLALHSTDDSFASPARAKDMANLSDRVEVGRVQLLVLTLAPIASATTTASNAIANSLKSKPAGVFVDRVVFSEGTMKEIELTGHALSRDGISAYQSALRSDPRYKKVVVPVRDLAGTTDGKFTVTLTE